MPELIALDMPPGELFVDQLKRAWDAGDAVLPLDTRLPAPARARVLDAMRPTAVIDQSGAVSELSGGRPVELGDALVMSTSGTTGDPKGVVLTHDALEASARMTSARLDVSASDKWLACLPVAHIGGLSVITRALITGTPFTVLPRFDVDAVNKATDDGCTLVSLVTAAMQRLDPSRFRAIVLGAGNLPSVLPPNVLPTYGMTETASGIVYGEDPLDGVELSITKDGEISVKSPTLLRCYRNGHDPKSADGWLNTGDAGFFDDRGKLKVRGRIGDMINTGGEKVWPAEVERVLADHPSIAAALVYGAPDSHWGQKVVADVELSGDSSTIDVSEVREWVKGQLPAYAAPQEVNVVSALARTALGKLMRPSTTSVDREEPAR